MYFREQQCAHNYLHARTTRKFRPFFSLTIIRVALSNWYDPSKFTSNNSLCFDKDIQKFVLRRLWVCWCDCLMRVKSKIQASACRSSWSTLSELRCAVFLTKLTSTGVRVKVLSPKGGGEGRYFYAINLLASETERQPTAKCVKMGVNSTAYSIDSLKRTTHNVNMKRNLTSLQGTRNLSAEHIMCGICSCIGTSCTIIVTL